MKSDYKFKGYTNSECEFFPCHKEISRPFNCLFCYCPLMHLECPGPYKVFISKYGKVTKDCSSCALPHDGIEQSWRFIQMWVPTAPLWDGKEQSPEKIRSLSEMVKEKFDMTDLKWATDSLTD